MPKIEQEVQIPEFSTTVAVMIKQTCALFIALVGLLLPSVSIGADVHLNVEGLTVNIQDEPLEGVLENLAQQANFDLTILQKRDFMGETISEEFHNLSLEEGVHRLLPAWNYGITKDKKTGQIQQMFVISKRQSSY